MTAANVSSPGLAEDRRQLDQPRVVSMQGTMLVVWRRAEGIAVADLH